MDIIVEEDGVSDDGAEEVMAGMAVMVDTAAMEAMEAMEGTADSAVAAIGTDGEDMDKTCYRYVFQSINGICKYVNI